MKVLILTIGSRGDVQPFVALGNGLRDAGHTVRLATAESFQGFVSENSLDFAPLPNDLVDLLNNDVGRKAIEDLDGIFGAVKVSFRVLKRIKPMMRSLMLESWKAALEFEPDVIVYNSKSPGAPIAEKLDVPCALVLPFPQMVPTKEFPTLGMPELGLFNKTSYKVVQLFMAAYGGFVNEFRTKTLGLKKGPRFNGLHHMADGTPIPVLHCFSESVIKRPADWPSIAHVTGYWFLDDETPPSDELVSFLNEGEPPVYVGFGSMSGRKPAKVAAIVVESLKRANVRGIIATGWGGLEAESLPETILKIESAPHEWLFPKVSAVVHHGGAGTTAAGLRAACPTVICPFFGDQPFWGKTVFELGIGTKPIPQRKLSVKNLAAAIREVTSNSEMRSDAARIAKELESEDGVKTAVELISNM